MDVKEIEKNVFEITIYPQDLKKSVQDQLKSNDLYDENYESMGLCTYVVENKEE